MRKTERKPISKKLRFEVFKRDFFTCQYCGRMAPDVVLEIDHINPVKNRGTNSILNLITSCFDCNRGKGSKELTDNQTIKIQQEQLKELGERREQLKFMLQWREELNNLIEQQIDVAESEMNKYHETKLSEYGRSIVKNLINRFGLIELLESINIAFVKYDIAQDWKSWNNAFDKIGGICYNRMKQKEGDSIGS